MGKISKILNENMLLDKTRVYDVLSSNVFKNMVKETKNLNDDMFIKKVTGLVLDLRKVVLADEKEDLSTIYNKY